MHGHLQVQAAVMGGHDRIGEAGRDAVIRLRDAAVEQPFRADQAADLLVEGEVQLDPALQLPGDRRERQQREGISRQIRLGDGDAAPVHEAVRHLGREGRVRPALAGRDHVAMRVERDHRSVAEAAARDEVGAGDHADAANLVLRHGVALHLEAEPLQQFRGDGRDRRAIAGRIGGGGLDEPRQERLAFASAGVDLGQHGLSHLEGKGHAASIRCCTVRSSVAKPAPESASVMLSAGLWLIPPLQRTKIMPMGQSAAIAMPS